MIGIRYGSKRLEDFTEVSKEERNQRGDPAEKRHDRIRESPYSRQPLFHRFSPRPRWSSLAHGMRAAFQISSWRTYSPLAIHGTYGLSYEKWIHWKWMVKAFPQNSTHSTLL